MTYLCAAIVWAVTFALEWLFIAQFDRDAGRAGVIAFCIVAVCVSSRYRYLPGNEIRFLTREDFRRYLMMFVIAIVFSLGLDFYFFCTDWQALFNWANYVQPGGAVRYAASALIVPVGLAMYFGTVAEAVLVNAIVPMPADAETIRSAARLSLSNLDGRSNVNHTAHSVLASPSPLWIRVVARTREIGGLALCSPALYAMYLYRNSHAVYALFVVLVWAPVYLWTLAQLHKWRILQWQFSLFATAVVLFMGWILFLSRG